MRDLIGQQLGNYRLVKLLGRGGFAEVYLGQHVRLSTQTAIKVLYAHLSEEQIKGFEQEAKTIASLEHPHIVRILDFDVINDLPFLVMDYCPDGTLRERHRKGERVPISTVVSYVQQVANALQYAHDQKIIHRDIKPENMLIGQRNALQLSDFGIAATAHSTHSMRTQDFAGTAAYMAPEQIKRHPRRESDQYALAVVTYEWLAGSLPFVGTPEEIAIKHLAVEPPSLCQMVPHLSESVEEVVMKALAKDPHQRFATVQAFATALEQASQPKPSTPLSTQPNPVPPQPTLPPGPPILAPATVPIQIDTPPVQPLPPRAAPTAIPPDTQMIPQPPTSKHPALKPRPALQPQLTRRRILIGLAATGVVAAGGGAMWLIWRQKLQGGSFSHLPASPTRQPTLSPAMAPLGTTISVYHGHTDVVWAIAWSPDSKLIASGGGGYSSNPVTDSTIQVWDALTGAHIATYQGHSQGIGVNHIVWSPDGKSIVSSGRDDIRVWDAATAKTLLTLSYGSVWGWSLDGKKIVSDNGTIHIWDATNGNILSTYQDPTKNLMVMRWSPNNKYIASAGDPDDTVHILDASTGNTISTYKSTGEFFPGGQVFALAWSPDNTHIASAGDEDQKIHVWNAITGGDIRIFDGPGRDVDGHFNQVNNLAFSPDGQRIVAVGGSESGTAQIWSVVTGKQLYIYRGHTDFITPVAWSPDGMYIATGGGDKTVRVWKAI